MVKHISKVLLERVPWVKDLDPKVVAYATGDTEQEIWEYLCELDFACNEAKAGRNEAKIQAEARDWANSLTDAFETRRAVAQERIEKAMQSDDDEVKKKALTYYRRATNKTRITDDMIENAKSYDITQLVETKRGMAICPFHGDTNPSMNVRKNFYFCHTCQATGDTIKFLMERDGMTFKEAVLALQ